jgi:DNA-binding NtrC family response regulator
MMASGSFRSDLFFRLNVVPVRLPSLRERKDDIPMLTRHFVDKLSRRHGLPAPSWSDPDLARSIPEDRWSEEPRLAMPKDLLKKLMSYDWPGNIRELEHALEKWVLLGGLPAGLAAGGSGQAKKAEGPVPSGPLRERLRELERRMILEALRESEGNKARAAKLLMVSYKTLFNRIVDLGIEVKKKAK